MTLQVNQELLEICVQIVAAKLTPEEWAAAESSEMFQSLSFCGGYDADEEAFCFSYYDGNRKEYWFQLTLGEVEEISTAKLATINLQAPE